MDGFLQSSPLATLFRQPFYETNDIYTIVYIYWAFLNRYHKRCGMAAYCVGLIKSFKFKAPSLHVRFAGPVYS